MTGAPEDPTVLSNFAHADAVELLLELPHIVTVPEVKSELERGCDTHPHLENAVAVLTEDIPVVFPTDTARPIEEKLLAVLDPGEAQAVAEATDGVVVTDDGDARRIADEREVPVTGSIGLLVRFVENGRLSATTGDTMLKRWIDDAGFRSPARDLEVFLD